MNFDVRKVDDDVIHVILKDGGGTFGGLMLTKNDAIDLYFKLRKVVDEPAEPNNSDKLDEILKRLDKLEQKVDEDDGWSISYGSNPPINLTDFLTMSESDRTTITTMTNV